MSEYLVRWAEKKDIPTMQELLFQVNNVHAIPRSDLFKVNGIKYDEEALAQVLDDPKNLVWVCQANEEVLGYGISMIQEAEETTCVVPNKTLYIDDICVSQDARGTGVGQKIFEHIKEYCRENDFDYITLNVWECNPGARAFYEKMGLVPRKTMMEMKL